jgi:hypothetical protein
MTSYIRDSDYSILSLTGFFVFHNLTQYYTNYFGPSFCSDPSPILPSSPPYPDAFNRGNFLTFYQEDESHWMDALTL